MQKGQFILPRGVTVVEPGGNRFVIEKTLGRGEFGAVYLVRERDRMSNFFALKEVINPNKDDRERFAFEGEVLKRLRHRALPRVHHVFENDKLKRVYLLMDYIEGENLEVLRQAQPDGRFPLSGVLLLMAPIVDAMKYLHSQNPPIVHRDIKPANIIVPSSSGEAKLADFGSAKEYVPGTATMIVERRSHGYAALEQYRSGTTPATDIFGLGATFYTLLTGLIPIDSVSRATKLLNTSVDPLKPVNLLVPAIPNVVAEAIQRALSIGMDDRFKTVDEFWREVTAQGESPELLAAPADLSREQGSLKKDTPTVQSFELLTNRSNLRNILSLIAGLLMFLTLVIAVLSYLLSIWGLFFICVGVFLLALGVLLYDWFSWVRRSKDAEQE